MDVTQSELNERLTRLLARAVDASGKTVADIARLSGLKYDTVRRTIAGKRHATMIEAVAILDAAGLPGEQALLFMLLIDDEFAATRAGSEAACFLKELFRLTPTELIERMGEDLDELRPRWANGTAKLLARTLSQHVADLNRRGDAIGERHGDLSA